MKTFYSLLILLAIVSGARSQSNPQPVHPDVTITHVLDVQPFATRLAKDPATGDLYYATWNGEIYRVVMPAAGQAYDTLVADSNTHGVTYVQGLCFFDSTMYVSGNLTHSTPMTSGIIVRGVLQSDGTRLWSEVARTEPYETADYFDHLFSGSIVNRTGDTIYVCSGARGDHGEVQTRYGLYPGIRNKPITSVILQVPLSGDSLIIPDDSLALDSLGYIMCRGIRNAYDFAFNSAGDLFAAENSGDRDMDDELNWIRHSHHYGFPWYMGNSWNPQQAPGFDPSLDTMINHASTSWVEGFFSNDSTFPQHPPGMQFTLPCRNLGPDADHFRDSVSGAIIDASATGAGMYSFTAHRSPLGIVFDNDSVLAPGFRGNCFITSFTRGDSTLSGPSPLLAPFGDPSEDILMLTLMKDSVNDNYEFTTTRIAEKFSSPVDMEQDSTTLYLIEVSFGGVASIWAITFPGFNPSVKEVDQLHTYAFPNPCNDYFTFFSGGESGRLTITDLKGAMVQQQEISSPQKQTIINASQWSPGMYQTIFHTSKGVSRGKLVVR